MSTTVKLELETFGQAREISAGFWLIATRHRPGLSKRVFEVNNRCLVLRLHDAGAGAPCLVVVNAVEPREAIPEVLRLEQETGLAVRYIMSPGGGHHLHMAPWHAAFQQARVLFCPMRVPMTANGRKLLELPRVELMNLDDPLPQFRGQLDAVIFHGLVGPGDAPTPAEGGSDTMMAMMKSMVHVMRSRAPADELWLHHAATGTVIAGETWRGSIRAPPTARSRSWHARWSSPTSSGSGRCRAGSVTPPPSTRAGAESSPGPRAPS